MEAFGSTEFWDLRMSPVLVGTTAAEDLAMPDNVRSYYFPGTTHGGGPGGFSAAPAAPARGRAGVCVLPANPNPESDTLHALLRHDPCLRHFLHCVNFFFLLLLNSPHLPKATPANSELKLELPRLIHRLDGLLIGGGFLVRFDKQVAPGYSAPASGLHHPTGYWLTPALIALQHDVPVIWNAPGTDGKEVPEWANPLMRAALDLSRYVAVRDEASRSTLQALTGAPVTVVPDTAFGLRRLVNFDGPPSTEFTRLCDASGLHGPYIVVQAKLGFEGFVRFVKDHAERFRDFQFLVLPIGPELGDRHELIDADLPGAVHIASWPAPLVLAELIDIPVGSRLYMNVVVHDHALRTAFVDAVIRTGVPPANPLYWPGHAVPMRNYYFWYVLCAIVSKLAHVTARQALDASCVWAGSA